MQCMTGDLAIGDDDSDDDVEEGVEAPSRGAGMIELLRQQGLL